MGTENNQENMQTYLEDLQTIKSLLIKVENTPLIEKWVFITWGIFILIGTILHLILSDYGHLSLHDLGLKLWLPVILIGGVLEAIGWFQALGKESLTLSSPRVYKFYINFIGTAVCLVLLGILITRLGGVRYLGVVILFSMAIIFFNFSLTGAYTRLTQFGIGFLLGGILLLIFHPPVLVNFLVTGLVTGISMLLAGLLKSHRGQ